jgi:predicted heme/steroid binding protein
MKISLENLDKMERQGLAEKKRWRNIVTSDELARFDGHEGRRAYVAIKGKVYDFTDSPMWQGGGHAGQHQAGRDLTAELLQAPHVRAVVERYPVVGELVEAPPVSKKAPIGILIAAGLLLLIAFFVLFR